MFVSNTIPVRIKAIPLSTGGSALPANLIIIIKPITITAVLKMIGIIFIGFILSSSHFILAHNNICIAKVRGDS